MSDTETVSATFDHSSTNSDLILQFLLYLIKHHLASLQSGFAITKAILLPALKSYCTSECVIAGEVSECITSDSPGTTLSLM